MGYYDINYDQLISHLLPTSLRQPVMKAWLNALISPVKLLYGIFKQNRNDNLYRLSHPGQVCFLEALLNDTFDPFGRAIYITDGAFEDPLFLFLETESKYVWLGLVSEAGSTTYPDPEPLYTDAETYSVGISFIVHVPIPVTIGAGYSTDRIRALIDLYRLPGRSVYTIVTF